MQTFIPFPALLTFIKSIHYNAVFFLLSNHIKRSYAFMSGRVIFYPSKETYSLWLIRYNLNLAFKKKRRRCFSHAFQRNFPQNLHKLASSAFDDFRWILLPISMPSDIGFSWAVILSHIFLKGDFLRILTCFLAKKKPENPFAVRR